MKNTLPFISIIVPVYNGEKALEKCITSLLNQNYPSERREIIIVDNNSKDNSKGIIQKFPVQYMLEDKIQGPGAARNTGAKIAKGEIIAFLDADQVADKNWLTNLIQGWENPAFGAFGGSNVYLEDNQLSLNINPPNTENKESSGSETFQLGGGNAAYRSDLFRSLNGFDTRLFNREDFDLAWRLVNIKKKKILFNYSAVVYQKGRTISEHLRREFRIGFGMYQFTCKHPGLDINLFQSIWRATKRTFTGLIALIVGLIKPLRGKSRKEHLATIALDIAMRWANTLGRFQCMLLKGKRLFSADW